MLFHQQAETYWTPFMPPSFSVLNAEGMEEISKTLRTKTKGSYLRRKKRRPEFLDCCTLPNRLLAEIPLSAYQLENPET